MLYNPLLCRIYLTHLTDVTVDVEATVQSHYPDRLLLARFRHDGLTAHGAARRVLSVRDNKHQNSQLVEISETSLHVLVLKKQTKKKTGIALYNNVELDV